MSNKFVVVLVLLVSMFPVEAGWQEWQETAVKRKEDRLRYRAVWFTALVNWIEDKTQEPEVPLVVPSPQPLKTPAETTIEVPPVVVEEVPVELPPEPKVIEQTDPLPEVVETPEPKPPVESKAPEKKPDVPKDYDPQQFPMLTPFPYNFNVLEASRDQIAGFNLKVRNHIFVSLDFDCVYDCSQALVVVPNKTKPNSPLGKAAVTYVKLMRDTYGKEHGMTIRQGNKTFGKNSGVRTRAENKRGWPGVVHVEGFDSKDSSMMREIQKDPETYARILAQSFGKIGSGLTFIAPHTKRSQGAYWRGISERTFALEYVIPELIALRENK